MYKDNVLISIQWYIGFHSDKSKGNKTSISSVKSNYSSVIMIKSQVSEPWRCMVLLVARLLYDNIWLLHFWLFVPVMVWFIILAKREQRKGGLQVIRSFILHFIHSPPRLDTGECLTYSLLCAHRPLFAFHRFISSTQSESRSFNYPKFI